MYYAQITNGICSAITQTAGTITAPNMVELQSFDTSLIGHSYANGVFTAPTPEPTPNPTEWFIDIGPFFDRFGAQKMPVLTSADAGIKAILQDVQVRKWIDLERADVASSLAYIGSKVAGVDATLQAAILTTPVAFEENLALRKLYF